MAADPKRMQAIAKFLVSDISKLWESRKTFLLLQQKWESQILQFSSLLQWTRRNLKLLKCGAVEETCEHRILWIPELPREVWTEETFEFKIYIDTKMRCNFPCNNLKMKTEGTGVLGKAVIRWKDRIKDLQLTNRSCFYRTQTLSSWRGTLQLFAELRRVMWQKVQ